MRQTCIMFDIGSVLLALDFSSLYREGAKLAGISANDFRESYTTDKIEEQTASGKLSEKELRVRINNLVGREITNDEYESFIKSHLTYLNIPMLELRAKFHSENIQTGIASNLGPQHHRVIKNIYPSIFASVSGPTNLSYQIGNVKPHPSMFQAPDFNNILFIDNNANYVHAASQMGWCSVQYTELIDVHEGIRLEQNLQDHVVPQAHSVDQVQEFIEANL